MPAEIGQAETSVGLGTTAAILGGRGTAAAWLRPMALAVAGRASSEAVVDPFDTHEGLTRARFAPPPARGALTPRAARWPAHRGARGCRQGSGAAGDGLGVNDMVADR